MDGRFEGRLGGVPLYLAAAMLAFAASGCATLPYGVDPLVSTGPEIAGIPADDGTAIEEEFSELLAHLSHDLSLVKSHQRREPQPGETAGMIRRPSKYDLFSALLMPVEGIRPSQLDDNFGDPRDGGRRSHRGIDIFAPRGTKILAVADGTISYIGEQARGGRCLWLTTNMGVSFYYAHLDRWASGLYEGRRVRKGELLGYVGNTGNAQRTPPHLHFQIADSGDVVDPYPILKGSSPGRATPVLQGGFGK